MTVSAPQVAICMATFEPDPSLLERQIASIAEQTHRDWICLISDDGSAPQRLELLRELTAGDSRFRLCAGGERSGFYLNFERALRLVPPEASHVALADQDDRWYPEKLAALLAGLGDARLVYSDMRIVDEAGGVISDTFWHGRRNNHTNRASLLLANTVTGAASLFDRELLDQALPFPAPIGKPFHDQWIASVALALGRIAYLDEPLYDYVQHGGAALGHLAAMQDRDPGRLLREGGPRGALGRIEAHGRRTFAVELRQTAQAAATIEARCGARLEPRKARAVRRLARLERSPLTAGWLALRSLRRLTGRNETMGTELSLLNAVAWGWLSAARGGPRPRRQRP